MSFILLYPRVPIDTPATSEFMMPFQHVPTEDVSHCYAEPFQLLHALCITKIMHV